jgi:hypothetical protein
VRGRVGHRADHGSARSRPTASARARGTVLSRRRRSGTLVRRRRWGLVARLHLRRAPNSRAAQSGQYTTASAGSSSSAVKSACQPRSSSACGVRIRRTSTHLPAHTSTPSPLSQAPPLIGPAPRQPRRTRCRVRRDPGPAPVRHRIAEIARSAGTGWLNHAVPACPRRFECPQRDSNPPAQGGFSELIEPRPSP